MPERSPEAADAAEPDADSWDWLTIMQGPEVSGKGRIWFGRHDAREQWSEKSDGPAIAAEPVQYVPLPRPMTRPEIQDWLEADDGLHRLLDEFDGDQADQHTESENA